MIKTSVGLGLLCLSCAFPVAAGSMGDATSATFPSLYVGALGGYGVIDGAIKQDGQMAQARLSLGVRAPHAYQNTLVGLELGIQSGNTMRLSASNELILLTGDLPIQATLNPVLDALLTLKYQVHPDHPLALIVKGGIAYRQLHLNDRTSTQDTLSKVNGEFQAGLGYQLTKHVQFTLMYQGIYSTNDTNAQYVSLEENDLLNIGYTAIANIPTQQAGFLGIEYTV